MSVALFMEFGHDLFLLETKPYSIRRAFAALVIGLGDRLAAEAFYATIIIFC